VQYTLGVLCLHGHGTMFNKVQYLDQSMVIYILLFINTYISILPKEWYYNQQDVLLSTF